MVEQICEKCGARYSLYAPACPKCGEPSTAPAKKPGCPQAPAASKPAPKAAAKSAPAANADQAKQGQDATKQAAPQGAGSSCSVSGGDNVIIEPEASCPCKTAGVGILALIGAIAVACGVFALLRK